jgi:hypothetical protein
MNKIGTMAYFVVLGRMSVLSRLPEACRYLSMFGVCRTLFPRQYDLKRAHARVPRGSKNRLHFDLFHGMNFGRVANGSHFRYHAFHRFRFRSAPAVTLAF